MLEAGVGRLFDKPFPNKSALKRLSFARPILAPDPRANPLPAPFVTHFLVGVPKPPTKSGACVRFSLAPKNHPIIPTPPSIPGADPAPVAEDRSLDRECANLIRDAQRVRRLAGRRLEINNHRSRPELDGRLGVLQQKWVGTERYAVRLDDPAGADDEGGVVDSNKVLSLPRDFVQLVEGEVSETSPTREQERCEDGDEDDEKFLDFNYWDSSIRVASKMYVGMVGACQSGDFAHVSQCLAEGESPDTVNHGDSALQLACKCKHLDCVRLLLDAHASTLFSSSDMERPLHIAITEKSPEIVEALLSAKASLHIGPSKKRSEHGTCCVSLSSSDDNNLECLSLLLQAKASPDGQLKGGKHGKQGKFSCPPILMAAMGGKASVVKVLLDAGARFDAGAHDGKMSVFEFVAKMLNLCSKPDREDSSRFEFSSSVVTKKNGLDDGQFACLKLLIQADTRLQSAEQGVRAEATNAYVTIMGEMSVSGCHLVVEAILAGGLDPEAAVWPVSSPLLL